MMFFFLFLCHGDVECKNLISIHFSPFPKFQSSIYASTIELSCRTSGSFALFKRYPMFKYTRFECRAHGTFAAQALRTVVHIFINTSASTTLHGIDCTKSGSRAQQNGGH